MRKWLTPSLLGAAFLMSTAAPCLADGTGVVTAGQMDLLNSQIAVLEAKLKIAKLHADIKDAGKSANNAKPSPYGQPMGGDFGTPAVQNMPRNVALPQVESISGAGGRMSAEVALSNGGQRIVTVGNQLPGGLVVKSITANGISVGGKHGVQSLPFANGSAPAVSNSGSGMGTPSGPTAFATPMMPPSPPGMPEMGAPGMGAPVMPGA